MAEYRDRSLDPLRHAPSELCWWCGEPATTREHKYKATDLRRIAAQPGAIRSSSLFKSSPNYRGPLKSIRRGSEVQWGRNLCATCNGHKSQPFDRAYDVFSAYVREQVDHLHARDVLTWSDVYGTEWISESRNLALYFGKQLGCMLATQDLDVPVDLIHFLNGATRCPSIYFAMYRVSSAINAHLKMLEDGFKEGMRNFIGIPGAPAFSDGARLTGAQYAYQLVYLLALVDWRIETDRASFFEFPEVVLQMLASDEMT